MDEKRFYSTVVRKFNKYVPVLGMEKPTFLRVNKKNHLYKEMYICSTAYIPNDNNISTGGLSYTLSCERVGHFVPAKKNTYRRVYAGDGTYSYPRIEENILRRRGELYFETLEITGSKEGSVSHPKYSLLNFFLDIEIPKLQELTDSITARYGHRAVVRYQMDNAGPHIEEHFSRRLQSEFEQRGWMLVPQPPNSPITNIKDAAIFPSLSKKVSSIQATIYHNKVLENDEINRCVQRAWNELPNTTISRAYLHNHQIAAAIVKDNGGDNFMIERGGLHCGVRCHATPLYDEEGRRQIGIYVAEEIIEEEGERRPWKYQIPDVRDCDILSYLNRSELRFLHDNIDHETQLWTEIDNYLVEE